MRFYLKPENRWTTLAAVIDNGLFGGYAPCTAKWPRCMTYVSNDGQSAIFAHKDLSGFDKDELERLIKSLENIENKK